MKYNIAAYFNQTAFTSGVKNIRVVQQAIAIQIAEALRRTVYNRGVRQRYDLQCESVLLFCKALPSQGQI